MKINVIGGLLGSQGYNAHVRGLVNGLRDSGHDVHLDTELWQGLAF